VGTVFETCFGYNWYPFMDSFQFDIGENYVAFEYIFVFLLNIKFTSLESYTKKYRK
jgi:hypothetical protein